MTTFAPSKSRLLIHTNIRRDGRVVDYNGLENRRTERYRGFESLSLRKIPRFESLSLRKIPLQSAGFFISKTEENQI